MIQAVLFDLDNTLYPHRQYVEGAFRAMADWIASRADVPAADAHRRMMAVWTDYTRRYDRFYHNILAEYGLDGEQAEQEFQTLYHSHVPTLTAWDGTADVLRRLGADLRLGLLTDGWAPTQRRKLAALGLGPKFEAIVFTGDLGQQYYKPHPRGFRMLLEQLAVEPACAVFVGDNPDVDIRGARDVGLWAVRILRGEYREAPDLPDAPPHRTCTELGELPALLADLQQEAG